jgi:hypothetical protein
LAARRTIKKDPLAAAATATTAEIVGAKRAPRAAAAAAAAPAPDPTPAPTAAAVAAEAPVAPKPLRPLMTRGREMMAGLGTSIARRMGRTPDPSKALGGKLELLGGALGPGWAFIRRVGPDARLGFLTGNRYVDLETELRAIRVATDHAEHRILSAAGWGWIGASLFGPAGAVVAGGIRLIQPRLTIVEITLSDGRNIVARTDGITAEALSHLLAMPSWDALPAAA